MNLIEKLGIEKCKQILSEAPELAFAYDAFDAEYLFCGDIQDGYSIDDYEDCITLYDLSSAIAEYENTDHCTDIGNHISPLTKVIER